LFDEKELRMVYKYDGLIGDCRNSATHIETGDMKTFNLPLVDITQRVILDG
jgi:hypothetical protein